MTRKVWRNWNRKAIADWIELERTTQNLSYAQLESKMDLPYGTIDWWRLALTAQLSPTAIQAIAHYRRWPEEKVKHWLNIEA